MGLTSLILTVTFALPTFSAPLNSLWYDAGFYGSYLGQNFRSFPLVPPAVNFLQREDCNKGYTFLTPQGDSVGSPGPLILDANGGLIWMSDEYGVASDFKSQTYRGEQYLTFWAGTNNNVYSNGSYHMLDSTYNSVYTIYAVGDLEGDLYEFEIVGDTALITIHQPIPADLTTVGGPQNGRIYDGLFQEIDIETGELKFQWRSSDHFNLSDSFEILPGKDSPFDFFRITSIDKDQDGNYYVSSRNTHTVTCVSSTGDTKWILGGKRNEFRDISPSAAANFSWQNHVRWSPGGVLTLLDNGASDSHSRNTAYSRGLKMKVDEENMTVALLQEYLSPARMSSSSGGSLQTLDNGNVFLSWGHNAGFTEFSTDGQVVCDAHFGALAGFGEGHIWSPRGFKGNWIGRPRQLPEVMVSSDEALKLFVSWNGATEVEYWRIESTAEITLEDDLLAEAVTVRKSGFETAIKIPEGTAKYLRLVALDRNNHTLTKSDLMDGKTGTPYLITACVFCTIAAIAVWATKKWGPYFDEDEAGVEEVKREWLEQKGVTGTKTSSPQAQPPRRQPPRRPTHSRTPSRYVKYRQGEERGIADAKPAAPPSPIKFKHGTQSRYLEFKKQDN